jgi:hypothetical protein
MKYAMAVIPVTLRLLVTVAQRQFAFRITRPSHPLHHVAIVAITLISQAPYRTLPKYCSSIDNCPLFRPTQTQLSCTQYDLPRSSSNALRYLCIPIHRPCRTGHRRGCLNRNATEAHRR